jgi:hypothetical protein
MEGIAAVSGPNDPDDFLVVLRTLEVGPRPGQLAPSGVKVSPLCIGWNGQSRDMPRPRPRIVWEVDKLYTPISLERAEF